MEVSNLPPPVNKERAETDNSLVTERDKTDESLRVLREQNESETDENVKLDRQDADETKELSRMYADSDSQKADKVQDIAAVVCLEEQREENDVALERERLLMDEALRQERLSNEEIASKLLSDEREQTNQKLLHERVKMDAVVKLTSERLTIELSSHSDTKAELTTRDEFLAIVSHDLRNPIGGILSSAQILLENPARSGLAPDSVKWVEMIQRNAEASLRLISDILDMERIVGGKLQLQLGEHDLNGLVRRAVENYAHTALAKKIQLGVTPLKGTLPVVCDGDRIAQVLSNLIGNALKFTPEGGSVTVKTDSLESELEVSVSDTGPGIPDDQRRRIFERYTQLNKKDRRGLGLGLYISKMLIEAHRGKLRVASSVGRGSTFSFSLHK